MISGTSMGAIIGAVYASGFSGEEIRKGIHDHIISKTDRANDIRSKKRNLLKWFSFVRLARNRQAVLSSTGFIEFIVKTMGIKTFEQLQIPLHVVATDFYRDEPVFIGSGDIAPAVEASMAIPGIFKPVTLNGRVLVDGGVTNNLPYEILMDECDIVIAIDVVPTRLVDETTPPTLINAVLGTFDSLIERMTVAKLEKQSPSIYVKPKLIGIRTLDFDKIDSIYEQAQPAIEDFKSKFLSLIDSEDLNYR
jgi:NTE family protein